MHLENFFWGGPIFIKIIPKSFISLSKLSLDVSNLTELKTFESNHEFSDKVHSVVTVLLKTPPVVETIFRSGQKLRRSLVNAVSFFDSRALRLSLSS